MDIDKVRGLKEERNEKLDKLVELGDENDQKFFKALRLLKAQSEKEEQRLINEGVEQYGEKMLNWKKKISDKKHSLEGSYAVSNKKLVTEFFTAAERYNREIKKLKEEE